MVSNCVNVVIPFLFIPRLLGWNPSLIDDEDDDDTTNSLITVLERPVRFSDFALQYLTITQ
jgi:hypothetical protein